MQKPAQETTAAIPPFSYAQAAKGRTYPTSQSTSGGKIYSDSTERELKRTVSAERDVGSNNSRQAPTKRTASEGGISESRDRPEKTGEPVSHGGSNKERTNFESALKPKEEVAAKCASVPSSPEYGTTSTSTLPKEEDIFSTGNGSSDSTWEKQSQSSQNGCKNDEKPHTEKEPNTNMTWEEEAPIPSALKEAPPPILNIWQQRKEAQEAKAKAKQPVVQQPPRSSNNNSGKEIVNGNVKSMDGMAESKKQEPKRKAKAIIEERLAVENAKGGNKDGKARVSQEGKCCYNEIHVLGQLTFTLTDKSSTGAIAPPPPPGDAISWPTPDNAGGEEKKRPQERPDEGEKEKENAQMPKASGKKAWTHVPFVPTAVFNTPLPQARRGGRGPSGGGRESAPRGRNNANNVNSADKSGGISNSAPQNATVSSDKVKASSNSLTANSGSSKPKRASSAGPASAKEQRKGGDAAGTEKRKEGDTEDIKSNQPRRTSVHESRRPLPAPIPATPQVGRSTGRAIVNEALPPAGQAQSRSYETEKQSQATAREAPSHPRNAAPERRSEGSIRPSDLAKDFSGSLPNRDRGEERAGRGRGGHRGRGNANHNAYNGHVLNGYGYTNGHPHQYQAPPASQSRSFSNHERISSQSHGAFFGPSPPHRSFRAASRSHYNPGFMSAGGRFSHGTNQGPSHLPSIQTDLANMSTFQNGAQGIMSAMPFDDPYMQHITLFDMVTTQMEYYFSLDNLCKDMFLRKHMDSQGYVFLSVLAGFNRIVQLTTDIELIRYVCLNSQKIEFKPGPLWQDGRDRLRAREDWDKFVLSMEQRDPSAQVDAPPPAQHFQNVDSAHGVADRHGTSPKSTAASGSMSFPYHSLDAMTPPSTHAAPAASMSNGIYTNANQPPLSAAVSDFAPSLHSHSSRRFASPDPRSHETKAFTDEEVQNLRILVRQPINSVLPPFHSPSSRTFSNGSIDGRNINDELSKSAERQPRPVNGEVFERWAHARLSVSFQ